jgi:predicted acyltransferase
MSESFEEGKTGGRTDRLLALDAFRGLTIAGMILVNNPGSWSHIYDPLEHAAWHGWTPTDLIFPFFLFIVGVSVTLAFAKRTETDDAQKDLYIKIIRRTLIIFLLGLFLAGFPRFDLSTIRIPGVLQRIAVCYFFASIIFLNTKVRTQAIIGVGLLLLYWLLMTLVAVPGFGAGDLSKEGNLAAYIDRTLLSGHIWKTAKVYDPEGILSTIPAIVTTLCGVLTGHWLRTGKSQYEKVAGMFVAGACAVVVGWAWHSWFPINKALWTSSYVVFTAGMALQMLALCIWTIDIKGYRRWATPFLIFGVNALAVFVLSGLLTKILILWEITNGDGSTVTAWKYLYDHLFASWAAPVNASLLFAITYVLLWLALMGLLYRKRIYIKV